MPRARGSTELQHHFCQFLFFIYIYSVKIIQKHSRRMGRNDIYRVRHIKCYRAIELKLLIISKNVSEKSFSAWEGRHTRQPYFFIGEGAEATSRSTPLQKICKTTFNMYWHVFLIIFPNYLFKWKKKRSRIAVSPLLPTKPRAPSVMESGASIVWFETSGRSFIGSWYYILLVQEL